MKRQLTVSLDKPKALESSELAVPSIPDPDKLNLIVKDQVTHLAFTIGTLLAGKKILDTLCEMSLIVTRSTFK